MSGRASAPVVAVLVLCTLAALLAVGLATGVDVAPADPAPTVVLDVTADAAADRVTLRHRAGESLDTRTLELRVTVDGTTLAHQPPVPFFSARGFHSGPTGAFNEATGGEWTAGETASFRIADTNEPTLSPDATVTVRVYSDGRRVAVLTTTA